MDHRPGEDLHQVVRNWSDSTSSGSTDSLSFRLNSKINVREVHVNDLTTDLSDGVGATCPI